MANNSSPTRKGGRQPPFEIVLDEACSIVCDDVPSNCTIRVLQVDGRSPPRLSPASKWVEDHPPGSRSGGNYPISSPQSPMRSRRSDVESVRRNMQENNGGASSSRGVHRGGEAEQDVFALRKPYCKYELQSPSPTQLVTSTTSYSSSSNRQPCSSSSQSAATDRLLNSNRAQMHFRRTNIDVGGTDLHEMHSDSGLPQASSPAKPINARLQWANPSPSPPSSRASPPSPARGGRCCGMAEYNLSHYQSDTPERDSSGGVSPSEDVAFRSTAVSAGATCSHHRSEPCPLRAGSYCRENREGHGSGHSPRSPVLPGARSCKFHDTLPCPALAGVPCRGEIQKSGTSSPPSRSPSPSPSSGPSSPRSPPPDKSASWQGSPAGSSGGVCYPPRTIAPPPKSPRSRTPHRRAPDNRESRGCPDEKPAPFLTDNDKSLVPCFDQWLSQETFVARDVQVT